MAGAAGGSIKGPQFEATCYDTALCIIPPTQYCREVDRLRELYDKGFGRWPAHINILYPFVAVEHLSVAQQAIQERLSNTLPLRTQLNTAGHFVHRKGCTIYTSATNTSELEQIQKEVLDSLGLHAKGTQFHLTIGQAAENSASARDFLLDKAVRLPPCDFPVTRLAILVREREQGDQRFSDYMRLWGTIDLSASSSTIHELSSYSWTTSINALMSESDEERFACEEQDSLDVDVAREREETTFTYNPDSDYWSPVNLEYCNTVTQVPDTLKISSYNVLANNHNSVSGKRECDLLRVITSQTALADILILQEVTDSFLANLLAHEDVLNTYNFISHAPSDQSEVGPLPSLRNIVLLSRFPFTWTWLPFQRRHKGASIAKFQNFSTRKGTNSAPFVVAAIHLTSGLTNGSVVAKKIQIMRLLRCLREQYGSSPWVIAGDFNMTTSATTISTAVANKDISPQTARTLASIDTSLSDAGLEDCWIAAKLRETADSSTHAVEPDLMTGEDGATFDPQRNPLAAGTSATSHDHPQRYDRILLRSNGLFSTSGFNMFGVVEDEGSVAQLEPCPSDHYGVRALIRTTFENNGTVGLEPLDLPQLESTATGNVLLDIDSMKSTLARHDMFPTAAAETERAKAFDTLKRVLLGAQPEEGVPQSLMSLIIVPVGSYALDLWTKDSDIDCLVVGNISSKTFFILARQRIRQSQNDDIRVIRKVEANSGTLLELMVHGIYVDLHYCQAAKVVDKWTSYSQLSSQDPVFDLPILSLRKLKPYRDLDYMRRTLPDITAFRLAYRAIKLWALQSGLYSSKFGYFGGIHLMIMLTVICKLMSSQFPTATASDIVVAFFRYYAKFDWEHEAVYDPFYHQVRPTHSRSAREPMVILGYHAPNANVAHTCTIPGLRVLVNELATAAQRLCEPSTTWQDFFGPKLQDARKESRFIEKFDTFARVDIQYWGRTQSQGRALVGWLEARCLYLVVEIQRALPNFTVRVWPARFASVDASEQQDYQGCYLIGISRISNTEPVADVDKDKGLNALMTVLARFEEQIHSDEKYYDASVCFVAVGLTKRRQLGELQPDRREWGDAGDDGADDETDEEDTTALDADVDEEAELGELPLRPRKAGYKSKDKHKEQRSVEPGARKLRPAADVLSRLRWDPSLTLNDYVVGYIDRFLGAREIPLEKWKTEQTDEEFIPQHRILYFKRKSDGTKIWERSTRTDLVFGSGHSTIQI